MVQWQATEDEDALLRGGSLARAENWLAERKTDLSENEQSFIQASIVLRNQENMRKQEVEELRRRHEIFELTEQTSRGRSPWAWWFNWVYPWSYWRKGKFKPGLKGVKELGQVIRFLGELYLWLDTINNPLKRELQNSVWKWIVHFEILRRSYLAVYSQDTETQIQALRQVAEIGVDKVIEVLKWVIDTPDTRETTRSFAIAILDEINQRQKPQISDP